MPKLENENMPWFSDWVQIAEGIFKFMEEEPCSKKLMLLGYNLNLTPAEVVQETILKREKKEKHQQTSDVNVDEGPSPFIEACRVVEQRFPDLIGDIASLPPERTPFMRVLSNGMSVRFDYLPK